MKDLNLYKIQILKWTAIGLVFRLILMPFTMHGQDLVFLNYFPMKLITSGIWDPYGFIDANFSNAFEHIKVTTYYGPVLFFIMAIFNFIFIKLFNCISLLRILELSSTMIWKFFTTIDYIHAFSNLDLFKNLFLMKTPYLIFDFFIAIILLKLALSKDLALNSYKLWMFNIVVLQSVYAVGGAHIIPAFFIILALYAALKRRPYLCIVLLSAGGATKLFPYILILPACLLLGPDWKKRFALLFTGGIVSILIYLPFYLSSGSSIFKLFTSIGVVQYSEVIRWTLGGIFLVLYSFVSINATRDSHVSNPETKLLYYFIIILFLSYATFPVRFRYIVPITPLLALFIPQHKKFGIFILFIILMLAFLWLTERDLQLGLFAPINPVYFLSLPTFQEIVARFTNIEMVYKIMCRVLLMTFFVAAWWVWRIKLNIEKTLLGFAGGRSQ